MSKLKRGIALLCLTSLAICVVVVWQKTRITTPVEMAWTTGAEHWRTPDFKFNVSTTYDVEISQN